MQSRITKRRVKKSTLRTPLLVFISVALLTACGTKNTPPVVATPQPVASIQEIMQAIVDPSADALWESVSSTVTSAGIEDKQPASEAEWLELRHLAIGIVEAANLLIADGRVVAHAGHTLEDAHVAGILVPAEIEQKIAADRPAFAQKALALQQAAQNIIAAIDARNIEQFLAAGGQLDHACESCHKQYWYPNDKVPTN
jgi:hypothetical protein